MVLVLYLLLWALPQYIQHLNSSDYMTNIPTTTLFILRIVVAIVIPFTPFLSRLYIQRWTVRKENLRKLYSVSKTLKSFFMPDLSIMLDPKNYRRNLKIFVFFAAIDYLILILSSKIPESYYIYLGSLLLFITFIPPYMELFLERFYKAKEKKSMIRYLIAKNEKLLLVIQIYSLAIMLLFIAVHRLNHFYIALAGAAIAMFIIFVIRKITYKLINSAYGEVFKDYFKGSLYVEVITKYTKLQGKILSIGDYLIIEDKNGSKWPIDWHSIMNLALIKEVEQDKT